MFECNCSMNMWWSCALSPVFCYQIRFDLQQWNETQSQGGAAYLSISCYFYSGFHKSVKHFKNSQQINYSTYHGSSYADRERNSPSFFYIIHRCSMCPPLVIRQTSMRQSISFHTRVSISRLTGATAAVIRLRKSGDKRGVEAQRQCPSHTPRRKSPTGLNPGTGVATALTRHLFSFATFPPLWQVSIEIPSHVFVVSRRAVLLKDVIITVFIQP